MEAVVGQECAACGRPASNAHHIMPRGSPFFGDDVAANLLALCGSGTTGCHGLYHHADPAVRARIGLALADRPDTIAYGLAKLGDGPGRDFLERHYLLTL